MEFTRIDNDNAGNPRYIAHFLECEPESWKDYTVDLSARYARTVKLMNQVGLWGKKFHNKQYGGGIVFNSYNLETLEQRIEEAKKKADAAPATGPLTLKANAGSTPISHADALRFFGQDAIDAGERRGEIKTIAPWNIITSYKALATTATWKPGPSHDYVDEYTLHGDRTMSRPKQSGYELEGYVSIDGEKRSCFTSSILFELPDGKLINVAVIHARSKKP